MARIKIQIQTAPIGESIPYHRGASLSSADPRTLEAIRELYDNGEIDLAQRRVEGWCSFEYIAQRRRRRADLHFVHTFKSAGLR